MNEQKKMRVNREISKAEIHNDKQRKREAGLLKFILILILILLLIICAMTYYSYRSYQRTLDSLFVRFIEDSTVINIGEIHKSMEYVAEYEGDIEVSEEYLRTDEIGERSVSFRVYKSLFGGLMVPSKDFTFTYTVRDAISPVILKSGDGSQITRGSEFDIRDLIAYGDNDDPSPTLVVDGEVNSDEIGSYPLHISVSDRSGNTAEWDLTVHVVEEIPSYTASHTQTPFSEFMSAYKGAGRSFGIDVSTWQDDIDFDAVKAAGCEFVIIRIGYSVAGVVELDDKFEQNLEGAKKAGLETGIYLYSYDSSVEEVRRSSEWIINKLNGEKLQLPVVFDWEDFWNFNKYEMSFNTLNQMYDAFSEELNSAGYDAMLYSSRYYLDNVWEDTDKRPVWLAHYVDETGYEGPFRIWQASCTGKIDGINGDVDMNILFD